MADKMLKKHFFLWMVFIGIVGGFFLRDDDANWLVKSSEKRSESDSMIDGLEMSGWSDGEKQWHIKGSKIFYQNDIVIFIDVKDGILYQTDNSDIYFEAERIEYDEKNNLLKFTNGAKLRIDNKIYDLKEALWDGKTRELGAKKIFLNKDDKFSLNADKLNYAEDADVVDFYGNIELNGKFATNGQFKITANNLNCLLKQNKWIFFENISLLLDDEYEIVTNRIDFDDTVGKITMPNILEFKGDNFSGTAKSADGTFENLLLQSVFINNNQHEFVINANNAQIKRNNVVLLDANGTFDSGIKFTAKQLFIDNKKNIVKSSDEKKIIDFEIINISQENGINVSADKGRYNEKEKKFLLDGSVIAINKDGRHTIADYAIYDTNKKSIKFIGNIKSTSKAEN